MVQQNRRSHSFLLTICALLLLGGCASSAQRQARQAADGTRDAFAQYKACNAAVRNKPEYASLIPHSADPETGEPTMAQLTNEKLVSPNDARLLASSYDDRSFCRRRLLTVISTVRPDLAPIVAETLAKGSSNVAALVARKITWAEGARRGQALSIEIRQRGASADRQWIADLNASHQAEMAQRRAAANALAQWSAQQQMINAVNRPRQTNCTGFGNSVNCTSY